LGVAPASRFAGVAKKLVETALQNSRRPLVRIFVRPSNLQALQIYKSFGFQKISVRHNNYPDGEDALVMMRFKKYGFLE
jgi:ribosomal protein S18 acetylase RimI-like enzyme